MKTEELIEYRPFLFALSYNLTGNIQVAEDLVQDVFEKWIRADKKNVTHVKSYLGRMVINATFDYLEKQKRERDLYKGHWLPEPFIHPATCEEDGNMNLLDYAFLCLAQKLNPYERAVFVLREVFNQSYEEIGEMIEMKPDNCRQLLHRAKQKIHLSPRNTLRNSQQQMALLTAFLTALQENDIDKLKLIFKEDIALYSDGGGKAPAALKPLYGISKVMKFLLGVTQLQKDIEFHVEKISINGGPAVLLLENGRLNSFIYIDITDGRIQNIYSVRNPDKIKL